MTLAENNREKAGTWVKQEELWKRALRAGIPLGKHYRIDTETHEVVGVKDNSEKGKG